MLKSFLMHVTYIAINIRLLRIYWLKAILRRKIKVGFIISWLSNVKRHKIEYEKIVQEGQIEAHVALAILTPNI